jgi:WD40 repeat protein
VGKVLILDIDGNLLQGGTVVLEIREGQDLALSPLVLHTIARIKGKLPPAPALAECYQQWRSLYRNLTLLFRLGDRPNWVTRGSSETVMSDCRMAAQTLVEHLHSWLTAESFRPIREQFLEKLSPHESIQLILQTEDNGLRHLPWHLWDILQRYPYAELSLSAPTYERIHAPTMTRTKTRILAILGNKEGINVDADQTLLKSILGETELVFLVEPERDELQRWLWDANGWDILFFAGHSTSFSDGETGQIELSGRDRLSLNELAYALRTAIAGGLKLAIFNSCDGLGLARQLEQLHIPHMIVMREPVPDAIAHTFLKHFLTSFCSGQSLHLAIRAAREQLQALETQSPCATWLPILCQNPTAPPLTWQTLLPLSPSSPVPCPPAPLPPCPYQGLSAFQETDAAFFFGREELTEHLLTVVQQLPLVAVIGSSGSGKSSLVLAGLVPCLRRTGAWAIACFRAGDRPFYRLAESLIPLLEPDLHETEQLVEVNKLAIALQSQSLTLTHVVQRILHKTQTTRFLLVADQFEELYSLCSESDRQSCVDELLETIEHLSQFAIVLTLRADFCEQALAYRPLATALRRYPPELLGPMTPEELRTAIEKPANVQGIRLAEGLTERILDAIEAAPAQLPLLEFALTLLWERQSNGALTHAAYDAIGGVEQVLTSYAEQVYASLDETAQQQAQQIFTQLVHPGAGTADTRRLATRSEIGEAAWQLIPTLVNARLIVSHRDDAAAEEVVELAHEALIQEWQRLQQWLKDDRSFRTWQEQLRHTLRQWQSNQHDPDGLLRGASLTHAEHWLQAHPKSLSEAEQQFIETSLEMRSQAQKVRDRQRRYKILAIVGNITAAMFLTTFGVWQWYRAEVVQNSAQTESLGTSSIELFNSGKQLEALLQILRAGQQLSYSRDADSDTQTKLIVSLHQIIYGIRESNRLDGHTRTVISVNFSPDGQLLASASDDNTIKLWQLDGTLITTLEGHSNRIRSVKFSPSGQLIASASYDGTIRLWRRDGTLINVLQAHDREINSISFSPDGKVLASASADGTIKLWHCNGELMSSEPYAILREHQGWVASVSFAPDGQTLASSASDGTIKLWRREGALLSTLESQNTSVNSVAFSADGQLLISANNEGKVWLWQQHNGSFPIQPERVIQAHQQRIWSVEWNPDRQTFVTASADNSIKIWRVDGTMVETLTGHTSPVFSVSFNPQGNILASASADQTIRLWHPNGLPLSRLPTQQSPISDVSFSPDGQLLATSNLGGTVALWKFNGTNVALLLGHTEQVHAVSFSPSGRLLASAGKDGTVRLWTVDGQLLQVLPGQIPLFDVSFSPDGQNLATAGEGGNITIWRRGDGGGFGTEPVQILNARTALISTLAFSPDGQLLASAGENDVVQLWQRNSIGLFTSEPIKTLAGHTSRVNQVSFSPDGQMLATASIDGYVKLWGREGKLLMTLSGHNSRVSSVIFSPNSQILASATADGVVKIWSLNGSLLKNLQGHQDRIAALSFSPNSQVLASAGADQTVILWNLNFNRLMVQGCAWIGDYLKTNSTVSESDRHLCDNVPSSLSLR